MIKVTKSFFTDTARSVFYSLLISFAAILLFAVIVKTFGITEKTISAINTGIKTFAILTGVLIGIKDRKSGLIKGLLAGLLYIVLSFLIFALLDGGFANAKFSVFDLLLGAVAGIISGVIKVNLKINKKRK